MITSPDELISQLRDFTSALTPDSSRRTLFTHPVPATQIHGTAPEDQAVLQSDFVLFQASISDQMKYMIESMAHMTELINANAAASSANAAASPATSAVASSTKSAPAAASTANFVATPAASTANVATAPAASTANSDAIPPTLSGAPKPSALLLAKMNFAITNPDLYENDGYHKMTTPSTVCERVKKLKPGVWSALTDTSVLPGLEAELALTNLKFESMAIFPAMTDCDWAGEMVEALTLQPKSDRSRLVQSLLKVAVRCGTVELIDDQIAQINATGLFDRKLASAGDLRLETNLQHFDPSTQGGKHLWEAIGRLITSYFSRCRSGEQGRQDAEHEYAELKCDSHESVSTFLCTKADCYDDLTRTGATYTGYTRIQLVLLKLPKMLQDAYERFKGRCKEIGQWKDSRSIDYDLFAADIELVAISMPLDTDEDKHGDNIAQDTYRDRPARAVLAHAVSTHTDRKHGRTASDDHCWRYQFADACDWESIHGYKCKYDHLGDPAAFKLEVADEDGRCRNDSRPKGCTRKNCPFTHRTEDDSNAAKANPVMYPILPRRKPIDPNDDCRMYHFGANQCPAY